MIKNYLITAWRNLLKNKTFSAINVLGLAIGIAAFLLIINYFLLPLALIVVIALVTVLYQSVKAAIANPVKSLRTE